MNQEKIGRFIQDKRKEAGYTQSELGEKLGVSYKAVSKWERGICMPDVSIMTTLCKTLSINVSELLSGEKENKKNNEVVVDYLKYQKNSYKKKMVIGSIILFLVIISSVLLIYFINNYNKIRIYEFSGSSENFRYDNILFIETQNELYLTDGTIMNNRYEKKEIISATLKCKDRFITNLNGGYISENNGYGEYFDKKTLNNFDSWNIVVKYKEGKSEKEEVISLQNKQLSSSNTFFKNIVIPIVEERTFEEEKIAHDEWEKKINDKIMKNEEIIKKLLDRGFTKEPVKIFNPVTNEEMNVHKYNYVKKYKDGSKWIVETDGISDGYLPLHVIFNSDDYELEKHILTSNYFYFRSGSGEEEFSFAYNAYTHKSKCMHGRCPEDFIYMAKECVRKYEKEFEGIYEYTPGQVNPYSKDEDHPEEDL